MMLPSRAWLLHALFGSSFHGGQWSQAAYFLLRVYVGLSMALGGLDKLPVPDWFVDQVAGIGFPTPELFAFLASLAEFAGGLLLAIGLLTRSAALSLAITMGVAAFLFHGVQPLLQLHITQAYFWAYLLFAICGGGHSALDRLLIRAVPPGRPTIPPSISLQRALLVCLPAIALSAYGTYLQLAGPPPTEETAASFTVDDISAINLVGSFNEWDLAADSMALQADGSWQLDVPIDAAGQVEFKFAANGSWDLNAGETDQGAIELPLEGTAETNGADEPSNIRVTIPTAGTYRFSIEPATLTYRVINPLVAPEALLGRWTLRELSSPVETLASNPTLLITGIEQDQIIGQLGESAIAAGRVHERNPIDALQASFFIENGRSHTTIMLTDGQLQGWTHFSDAGEVVHWEAERME